jgi:hypothetical protein
MRNLGSTIHKRLPTLVAHLPCQLSMQPKKPFCWTGSYLPIRCLIAAQTRLARKQGARTAEVRTLTKSRESQRQLASTSIVE